MLGTKVMIDWLKKNFISVSFFTFSIYSFYMNINSLVFSEKITWFVLGVFCFCLTQLSRFKKIKGFGIEAELWDETQNKAEALTTQLSYLADLVIQGQVLNLNRMGMVFNSHIPRKIQWEKFQEIKRQYSLDSLEKASEQFQLIVLRWWAVNIDEELFNDNAIREVKPLLLKRIHSLNIDIASSFTKEGNRIIHEVEVNLENLKKSNLLEKQIKYIQETLEYLKAFVETGEFENEQWFSKLLEKDV
jgi:hypothetical protein